MPRAGRRPQDADRAAERMNPTDAAITAFPAGRSSQQLGAVAATRLRP
ncbi:hypothetical protein ACFYV5_31900 [Streptomyces sp. NPDC003035]